MIDLIPTVRKCCQINPQIQRARGMSYNVFSGQYINVVQQWFLSKIAYFIRMLMHSLCSTLLGLLVSIWQQLQIKQKIA